MPRARRTRTEAIACACLLAATAATCAEPPIAAAIRRQALCLAISSTTSSTEDGSGHEAIDQIKANISRIIDPETTDEERARLFEENRRLKKGLRLIRENEFATPQIPPAPETRAVPSQPSPASSQPSQQPVKDRKPPRRRPSARRLQVCSLSCSNVKRTTGKHRGVSRLLVQAHVKAYGMKGKTLNAYVTFSLPNGAPIRAAPGTPKEMIDKRGRLKVASAPKQIRFDRSRWDALKIYVPHSAFWISSTTNRYVATLWVAADGLTACLASETTIPINEHTKSPEAKRPSRILCWASVSCRYNVKSPSGPQMVASTGIGARGLRGKSVILSTRLRTPDGRPVMATGQAPGLLRDEEGRYRSLVRYEVLRDLASSVDLPPKDIEVIVPHRMLDLQQGKTHRLILTLMAYCGPVGGYMERDVILRMR